MRRAGVCMYGTIPSSFDPLHLGPVIPRQVREGLRCYVTDKVQTRGGVPSAPRGDRGSKGCRIVPPSDRDPGPPSHTDCHRLPSRSFQSVLQACTCAPVSDGVPGIAKSTNVKYK